MNNSERLIKKDVSCVSADLPSTATNSQMGRKQERQRSTDFGGGESKFVSQHFVPLGAWGPN